MRGMVCSCSYELRKCWPTSTAGVYEINSPWQWRAVIFNLRGPELSVGKDLSSGVGSFRPHLGFIPARKDPTCYIEYITSVEMATTSTAPPKATPVTETKASSVVGIRKNGKQWHEPKKAFRRTGGQTSYAKRVARESQAAEVKQIEKEMKQEKEDERQVSHAG